METISPTGLLASTGNSQVDAILRGLIGIYKTVFPERLRCLYIVGSYSDGSAVPGSDLDLGVVFTKPLAGERLAQFRQINQSVALISPVRLDCGTVVPERFTSGIPAGLKSSSGRLRGRCLCRDVYGAGRGGTASRNIEYFSFPVCPAPTR